MKRALAQRAPAGQPRRIAIITGTRAEFGLFEPVLRALSRRPRIRTQLIVTGMHLLPRFGRTIRDIERAGWRIDATVRMQSGRDDLQSDAQAVARGVAGIARALQRLNSDVAVVLGDRIEAFAGATAAALSRTVVAHIHGGDRATGQTDDLLRNAITRLAHVHLVACEDARQRLLRMGEAHWRIHRVGAPGLDDIVKCGMRNAECGTGGEYALILQHPVCPDAEREQRLMRDILCAVERCDLRGAIIYPNSDPGHSGIIAAIRELGRDARWTTYRSLPREDYLALARGARVLVGNSSSGIIESASLRICAVNIGPRQDGRLRCGPSVVDVPAANPRAILDGLRTALKRPRPGPTRSVYGDGRAGERIATILTRLNIDERLGRKELTY